MILKCKRCGKEWAYKGKKIYYTSCPDCKTSIKISEFNAQKNIRRLKE